MLPVAARRTPAAPFASVIRRLHVAGRTAPAGKEGGAEGSPSRHGAAVQVAPCHAEFGGDAVHGHVALDEEIVQELPQRTFTAMGASL